MVEQRSIYAGLVATTVLFSALLYSHFTKPLNDAEEPLTAYEIHLPDPDKITERLAGVLRFKTVSSFEAMNHAIEPKEFEGIVKYLRRSFPTVFKKLTVQEFNKYSLLLKWEGSEPKLDPALCISHLDVVAAGDERLWTHDPFSGARAVGYVWGRGALDVKVTATALLEAVSHLLSKGTVPRRTLYLAFGHDEEVDGAFGAATMARQLKQAGVHLHFILDEGGSVLTDGIPGVTKSAVALVGASEKSMQLYRVDVQGKGGHSMNPPTDGTGVVTRLARAIQRLEATLPRPRMAPPTTYFIKALSRAMDRGILSAVLSRCDVWPVSLIAAYLLARTDGDLSACVRTTAVVTELEVSPPGANVIPSVATARVNVRLLPGDDAAFAKGLLEGAVRGERRGGNVTISLERGSSSIPVSALDGPGFGAIRRAALETLMMPQGLVVAPYLMLGRTDSSHYVGLGLTEQVFRFMPFTMNRTAGDVRRVHGVDERVSADAYVRGIGFYVRLLELSLSQ